MNRFSSWAFDRRPDQPPLLRAARTLVRILLIMAWQFRAVHVPLRASALTFSIVLSMVPMLAMGTAVLKGLGSDSQLRTAAYRFIDQFAPQPETTGENGMETGQAEDGRPVPGSLEEHLRNGVDMVFAYVDKTNFATLGIFGILGLLVVVIHVLSTVEEAMNAIWHADQGRNLFRKIMDYLALLILLPISINVALAGDAVLHSPAIMERLHTLVPFPWLIGTGLKLLPFAAITLSLMVMYLFFPNARVQNRAAFIGALFAAAGWFLGQRLYLGLQFGVARYNAIYGSFATLPLFLVWLQLGWTFILLGAVLAYAVQHRNQIVPFRDRLSPRHLLELCFTVLQNVYDSFSRGGECSAVTLERDNPALHPEDLAAAVRMLVRGGLLAESCGDPPGLLPTVDPRALDPARVVRLVLGSEQPVSPCGRLAQQVVSQAESALSRDDFPLPPQTENRTETSEHGI